MNEETEDFFGNDNQPELYAPGEREIVEFDLFCDYEKVAEKFKKTLLSFPDVENQLFFTVIYGLMFKKNEKEQIRKDNAREVLGDELFFDLKEIEVQSMLDH